jgi:RHS repeat-associated protein
LDYPDYDASSKPDARVTITYDSSTQATVDRYGTVAGVANQVMKQAVCTWAASTSNATVANQQLSEVDTTASGTTTTTDTYSNDEQLASSTTTQGSTQLASSSATISDDVLDGTHDVSSATTTTGSSQSTQTTTYTYDSLHRVTSVTATNAPSSTTTISTYDPTTGNLMAVTKTVSGSTDATRTEYSYDSSGRVTCEKQLISGTVTHNPDGTFTVTNGVWAETDYSNFYPDGQPGTTQAVGVKLQHNGGTNNLTRSATYDAFGDLLTQTDWGGTTTETNTYDIAGHKLTSTDACGVTTHTTYDCLGNATETYETVSGSSEKANWSTTTYDPMGRLLTITTHLSDTNGNPTTQSVVANTWDGNGDEITSSDSTVGGQPEKWLYDVGGNVTKHWAMGVSAYDDARATRTAYDAENRSIGESAPGDSVAPGPASVGGNPGVVGGSLTTYDETGQVLAQTNADQSQESYTYDGDGNTLTATSTATGTTTSTYGIADRLASQTNQDNFATGSVYDDLGRVTGATGTNQSTTTTEYSTLGWVLQKIDADGVSDSITYNAHGNVVSETIGNQGTTTSTYDPDNRLATQTDPNGNLLTNTYDAFGNLTEASHQDSAQNLLKDVKTTYDSLGRELTVQDAATGAGWTRTYTYPVNAATGTQETLTYDATPLTGTQIARDARNMEISRTTTISGAPTVTRSVTARDTADRWTTAQLQVTGYGALTLGRSFDNAGRVATQSGAGLGSAGSYSYSSTSGLESNQTLPLALGGTINDSYTYSADGRLHTWNGSTYTFDDAGNLTADSGTGTTLSYDATNQNRLMQSVSGGITTDYGWDAQNQDGWRISQGPAANPTQIQYTYTKSGASTSKGRMMRYQNSATGTDASYSYDAAGQRTKSTVTVAGTTTTTNFSYDGLTLLKLAATQGSSSWRIDYLYDEDGTPYGGVYRSPSNSTSPTYFTMITNGHGDVLELLDANGNAFASYRYDPWGSPLASGTTTQSTSLIGSALASQIASQQVLRYAGYAYDSESGLYYCSARYFDPATRQWTTTDPAKADGEESAYQYCAGDPVAMLDMSGDHMTTRQAVEYIKRHQEKATDDGLWITLWKHDLTWSQAKDLAATFDGAGTTLDSAEQAGVSSVIGELPALLLEVVNFHIGQLDKALDEARDDAIHAGKPREHIMAKIQVFLVSARIGFANHYVYHNLLTSMLS